MYLKMWKIARVAPQLRQKEKRYYTRNKHPLGIARTSNSKLSLTVQRSLDVSVSIVSAQ